MDERTPENDADTPRDDGESRRQFMKKLPWVAPVIETFLVGDEAYGQDRG